MHVVRGLHNLSHIDTPSVLTIGAYDGVHRGHQVILQRVVAVAKQMNSTPTVVLFEPQPSEYFSPHNAPARLSRFRDKVSYLSELGIERVICLRFDKQLCQLSPEAFVSKILHHGAQAKHLIIGDDFRFGANREGDFEYLTQAGKLLGFSVEDTPTTTDQGARVSSTRIRQALAQGDCAQATCLLGRAWQIQGRVGYGRQLGRTIGVPTANVSLRRRKSPVSGVFAVRIKLAGSTYCGVANVGYKPTVGREDKPSVEVHIFNFDKNIYGQSVNIMFDHKIRDEEKFASLDKLKQQIAVDQACARAFYAKEPKVIG